MHPATHAGLRLCWRRRSASSGRRSDVLPNMRDAAMEEANYAVCGRNSSVGAVVGATYPEQGCRLRALMPHTLFLVPGYGTQGATAADVVGCFDPQGRGAVVNASRSICFAYQREPYASRYGAAGYGLAARAATQQMCVEIQRALQRG